MTHYTYDMEGWLNGESSTEAPRSTTASPPVYNTVTELPNWSGLTWIVRSKPQPKVQPDLGLAKVTKNQQINAWRASANQTHFTHSGKLVACDALSRSDIDAVAGSISLNGTFPVGFPGAWKATDNSYIMLPDTDAFKAMYAAMTLQGTINFGHSQDLKAAVAAATDVDAVDAVVW